MVFGNGVLREVINHNGGALINEIYAIIKGTPKITLLPSAM